MNGKKSQSTITTVFKGPAGRTEELLSNCLLCEITNIPPSNCLVEKWAMPKAVKLIIPRRGRLGKKRWPGGLCWIALSCWMFQEEGRDDLA